MSAHDFKTMLFIQPLRNIAFNIDYEINCFFAWMGPKTDQEWPWHK